MPAHHIQVPTFAADRMDQTPPFQLLTFPRISWMTGHPIKHQGTQFNPVTLKFLLLLGGLQTPIVPRSTWYLGDYLYSR